MKGQKLKLRSLIGLLIFIMILSCSITVNADVIIDNNGNPRENPYGKCEGVKPSYEGVDYVDCYIPYAKTVEEIGGIAVGVVRDDYGYGIMPDRNKKFKAGDYANYQGNYEKVNGVPRAGYETDTGMEIFKDSNGNQYYASAIQKFFYNGSENGFYGWGLENRGQLFDVVLTNGVVIHFVVGDANGESHTNGWEGGFVSEGLWIPSTMNYPAYRSLFGIIAGNCLELWGKDVSASNKFSEKYNLKVSGEGVHIAFYRLYNKKISENPKRADDVGSGVAYSLDGSVRIEDSTIDSGGASTTEESESNSNDLNLSDDDVVLEEDLVGMSGLKSKLKDNQSDVVLPSDDNLSSGELANRNTVKSQISEDRNQKLMDVLRIGIVFLGLCSILYSVLLIVAYTFDKANNFFDVSLLSVISFGLLSVDDDVKGRRGGTSKKKLIKLFLMFFIVGSLIVSGAVFDWVGSLLVFLSDLIK